MPVTSYMGMEGFKRRTALASVYAVLSTWASGCSQAPVTLAEVLAPARGRLLDGQGRRLEVDDIIAASSGRTASLTFGYVGCGGPVSLASRVQAAALRAGHYPVFNLVLDAIDEPTGYAAVVRDVIGNRQGQNGGARFEIAFVEKDDLWPRQGNRTVQAILAATSQPMRNNGFVQDIKHTALFDTNGRFIQVRYL